MLLTTQHRHPSAVFERKTSEARSFSGAGGRNSERERLGSAAGLGDDSSESAEAEPWPGRDVGRRSSPGPPLTIQSPGKIFSRVGIPFNSKAFSHSPKFMFKTRQKVYFFQL